jgi:hypothetical protein
VEEAMPGMGEAQHLTKKKMENMITHRDTFHRNTYPASCSYEKKKPTPLQGSGSVRKSR